MHSTKTVLVLASGGVDSTACIHYYLSLGYDVKTHFVDYGQKAKSQEFECAKKVALHYGTEFVSIKCDLPNSYCEGEIVGRNSFLVLLVLMSNPNFNGIISLGIHSGVPYYDCSSIFVKEMNKIIEGYTDGRVRLDAPFMKWEKRMIYEYCKNEDIPVNFTYSCENGGKIPCGKCLSCLDRGTLNVNQ